MINPTDEQLNAQLARLQALPATGYPEESTPLGGAFALIKLRLLHTAAPTLADDDYLAILWILDHKSYGLDTNRLAGLAELASTEAALHAAIFNKHKAEETRRNLAPMLTEVALVDVLEARGWQIINNRAESPNDANLTPIDAAFFLMTDLGDRRLP